jgi:hypothetical protein
VERLLPRFIALGGDVGAMAVPHQLVTSALSGVFADDGKIAVVGMRRSTAGTLGSRELAIDPRLGPTPPADKPVRARGPGRASAPAPSRAWPQAPTSLPPISLQRATVRAAGRFDIDQTWCASQVFEMSFAQAVKPLHAATLSDARLGIIQDRASSPEIQCNAACRQTRQRRAAACATGTGIEHPAPLPKPDRYIRGTSAQRAMPAALVC